MRKMFNDLDTVGSPCFEYEKASMKVERLTMLGSVHVSTTVVVVNFMSE